MPSEGDFSTGSLLSMAYEPMPKDGLLLTAYTYIPYRLSFLTSLYLYTWQTFFFLPVYIYIPNKLSFLTSLYLYTLQTFFSYRPISIYLTDLLFLPVYIYIPDRLSFLTSLYLYTWQTFFSYRPISIYLTDGPVIFFNYIKFNFKN